MLAVTPSLDHGEGKQSSTTHLRRSRRLSARHVGATCLSVVHETISRTHLVDCTLIPTALHQPCQSPPPRRKVHSRRDAAAPCKPRPQMIEPAASVLRLAVAVAVAVRPDWSADKPGTRNLLAPESKSRSSAGARACSRFLGAPVCFRARRSTPPPTRPPRLPSLNPLPALPLPREMAPSSSCGTLRILEH
nr:hypothetical protein CFP56_13288 [Quercus suber]